MTSLKQWKRISIQIFEIMIGITVYCFSMDEVVQHAWHIKVIVKVRSCCQFANTCRSPVINRHWLPRFLRHQCHLILFEALRPKCWTLLETKRKLTCLEIQPHPLSTLCTAHQYLHTFLRDWAPKLGLQCVQRHCFRLVNLWSWLYKSSRHRNVYKKFVE